MMKVTVTVSLALCVTAISQEAQAKRYHITQSVPPRSGYRGPVVREMIRYPLAATVWMEARNQPYTGQVAVAWIIKNRVRADKDRWGHGLLGVVTKRKQFSCHNYSRRHGADVNRKAFFAMLRQPEGGPAKRQWRAIQQLSLGVWSGNIKDNTGHATFYATRTIKPYWRYDMTVVGQIADHVFFRPQTMRERSDYLRDQRANFRLAKARRLARRGYVKRGVISHHYRIVGRK